MVMIRQEDHRHRAPHRPGHVFWHPSPPFRPDRCRTTGDLSTRPRPLPGARRHQQDEGQSRELDQRRRARRPDAQLRHPRQTRSVDVCGAWGAPPAEGQWTTRRRRRCNPVVGWCAMGITAPTFGCFTNPKATSTSTVVEHSVKAAGPADRVWINPQAPVGRDRPRPRGVPQVDPAPVQGGLIPPDRPAGPRTPGIGRFEPGRVGSTVSRHPSPGSRTESWMSTSSVTVVALVLPVG